VYYHKCRHPWQHCADPASSLPLAGRRVGSAAGAACTPGRTPYVRRRMPGTSGCLCSGIRLDGDPASGCTSDLTRARRLLVSILVAVVAKTTVVSDDKR